MVQFTPPHSECSIAFGKGIIKGEPGSVERLEMVVSDIEAAREFLISRGVEVSDFFHRGESGFEPGLDPNRTSYNSYATFSDPDGNGYILQEVTERLPGRVWERLTMEVAELADLLHETAEHHDAFEKASPPHDWWDWYAAYMDARQGGSDADEASAAADKYMAEVKGVVKSS